jgi:hypothetical protein
MIAIIIFSISQGYISFHPMLLQNVLSGLSFNVQTIATEMGKSPVCRAWGK